MNAIESFGHGNCAENLELLTVAEVSAMLSVSKMTVYRMIHSGQVEHVRTDVAYRVVRDSLLRHIRASLNPSIDAAWRTVVESESLHPVHMEHI